MTSHGEPPDQGAMKASDVRFFWIEDGDPYENRFYHWCVDCAWVAVAAWHGARVASSEMPPPDANNENVAFVRKFLEEHLQGPAWSTTLIASGPDESGQYERWLCEVCSQYVPRAVPSICPPEIEPCEKCGCSRKIHVSCGGPFDTGCGMAWVHLSYGTDPNPVYIGLIHCPCDGYVPPAGGRPLTSSESPADGLFEGMRIDVVE